MSTIYLKIDNRYEENKDDLISIIRSETMCPVDEVTLPVMSEIKDVADEFATVVNSTVDSAFIEGAKWMLYTLFDYKIK